MSGPGHDPAGGAPAPRAFDTECDVAALVALVNAVGAHDGDPDRLTEARLRELLAWPSHNPARDRWVVDAPDESGALIAHGAVWKAEGEARADAQVAVRPELRRRGLGRALMDRALARANALGARQVGAYGDESLPAAGAFLRAMGFTPVAAYVAMAAPEDATLPEPVWPGGYRLRAFDTLLDWPLLVEALNRGYEGQWGHHTVREDDVRHWYRGPHARLDGVFLVAGPRRDLAGISRAELVEAAAPATGPARGLIDAPGVTPEHRDQPLRLPLLLTAARWLRAQGAQRLELESWGDGAETLALYASAGFRQTRKAISYARSIAAGRPE